MKNHPLELIKPRNLKHFTDHLQLLIRTKLWAKILVGMFAGLMLGFIFGPTLDLVGRSTAEVIGNWVSLPGRLFLALLQMIVIPLVFASVIRGIAANKSMDQLRTTGISLMVYFLITSLVAISIGIGVSSIVKPGNYVDFSPQKVQEVEAQNIQQEMDAEEGVNFAQIPSSIISVLPQNPINDAVQENMLQVVLFSIILGLALTTLKPEKSKPLLDLLGSILSVSMTIVKWAMLLAPIAVFGLMAELTMTTGLDSMMGVGVYVATIIGALLILLGFYLVIALIFGRWSPREYLSKIKEVQLLAFSTGSSVAVLPLTIKTIEEKLKIRPSIAQFVAPIGATINMDATALFQGAATIFLTQVYDLQLSIGVLLILIFTIIGSSIGTPATPGVGIIVLTAVLKSVGIPYEGLALIIGVDRILEMMRTSINVTGDMTASVVMDRLAKIRKTFEQEKKEDEEDEQEREYTGEKDTLIKPPKLNTST